MASPVQIASLESSAGTAQSAESESSEETPETQKHRINRLPIAFANSLAEAAAVEEATAYSVEFVARPCERERLRVAIPQLMRDTYGNRKGYSGCVVFISEQETRLVTVVTLWQGIDRAKHCHEYSEQVERLLEPYVDRWMRIKRQIALFSIP